MRVTVPYRPKHALETPLQHPTPAFHRKKGACVRSWLQVDSSGQAKVVEAGKHDIMRRTGLPARDLRILDPVLSYPPTVLGRDRAIVVSLEHIKAIITAQEVLFLNSRDPLVTPFVKKLQGVIPRQRVKSPQEGNDGNNEEFSNSYNLEEQQPNAGQNKDKNDEVNAEGEQLGAENAPGLKLLPFEFVALEACLETACSSLDDEARRLEQEAHPALDKLTSKISTLNLESVRQLKSRLVAITGRVQKVRDELEHLLDDDEDMAEMYLTEKLVRQLDSSSVSSISELNDLPDEVIPPDAEETTHAPSAEIVIEGEDYSLLNQIIDEPNSLRRDRHRTVTSTNTTSTHSTNTKRLDVEELEMILEAYFVQIEGTLNKLSALREYVDDTEDYINIMLDDKQNHLLQMGVMLTTATVVVSGFVALTGVFGMNIHIELFSDKVLRNPEFIWTVAGGTIGCVVMYVAAIAWCKHQRLLE